MCAHSLRCRVLLSLLVAFLLGFSALAYHLYDARDQLRRGIVYIQAKEISEGLTAASDFSRLPLQYAGGEVSYTLYDHEGQMLWYSSNLQRPRRLRDGSLADEMSRFRWSMHSGFVINVPVQLSDGSTLMVAKEDQLETRFITDFLNARVRQGLLVLAPFGLLGLGLVLGLLHWTLRPVRRTARLAADIGPSEPERRIPLDGLPRELVPLVQAANNGLERLSQAYTYEQHMVADAAHQLRTPLTVLSLRLQKCRAEGTVDWAAIDGDVSQACRLVNQLLLLARADRPGAAPAAGRAYLPRVLREAAADVLPLYEDGGRAIEIDVQVDVWVNGDPEQLREAVRNVLENALLHGEGVVRAHVLPLEDGAVALDVADEGPGVALDLQEDMFRRFRKSRPNTAGSGLGLAIVRRILRNAGGDAHFVSTGPCVIRLVFSL